jgi:hypothetical protein
MSATTRLSAGSASLPVTKRTPVGRIGHERGSALLTHLLGVPFQRAIGGGPPQCRLLDLSREQKVLVGDAAGAVCRQLDRHAPQVTERSGW